MKEIKMQLWRKFAYVAIGFFESLIFSGLIFGWPSLVHVFQIEGVYSHLCNSGEVEEFVVPGLENVTENGTIADEGVFVVRF